MTREMQTLIEDRGVLKWLARFEFQVGQEVVQGGEVVREIQVDQFGFSIGHVGC